MSTEPRPGSPATPLRASLARPLCSVPAAVAGVPGAAALKAAYGLAAFLTLQGASVLAMGAVMLWRRDPTANPALVYALAPVVLAAAAGTLALLRSYAGRAPAAARRRTAAAAHG